MSCAPECATAAQGIALALLALGAGLFLGNFMPPEARAIASLLAYIAAAGLLMWAP